MEITEINCSMFKYIIYMYRVNCLNYISIYRMI